QIVSLFHEPVKLDDQGKAKVDVPIPYFNGKVRVMALAFGESKFSSAETETTIAAPLVTDLGLPRFIAIGDTAAAAFDLNNMTGVAQNLKVDIKTGAGLKATSQQKTVPLEADRKVTLPFNIEGDSLAQGSVTIRVEGEGFAPIEREWKIGTRPAYPAEIRSANAVLDPSAEFTVPRNLFNDLHGASTEMLLSVGNRANLNLPQHIRDLLHYPYGCLEQTSSGAYPYAFATEQNQARFNMTPVTAQQRAERIDVALTRIAGMQSSNGGFGLWDDTSPEEHWLTVYVTDFMLNVQEQGFSVPPTMLEKSLARLTEYVNRTGSLFEQRYSDDMDHYRFAYKAYAAYVLARLNKAPLASLRTLHDQFRSHSKSGLPLLHLGIALQKAGDQPRADQAIKEAFVKARGDKTYLADYGSPVRDKAMMIYLLLKNQIHTEQALALSYELAADLKQEQYLSTQERNALFMAGVMLESTTGESWLAKLKVGDVDELLSQSGNAYRKFEGSTLQQAISISNTGNGRLFASAQVSGYPLVKPTPVEDKGYRIRRQYFDAEGKSMQLKDVRGGELVLVHLEVDSDVIAPESLVVDMLPAGFELENQNLEHAVKLTDFRIEGKTVQELQGYAKVMHQEYRDDRYVAALDVRWDRGHLFYLMRAVTPGEYLVPPPYVEDMYRAERRGVGATIDKVKVLPR
ncbi:MAG TPA: alpha-2-macroglobulin family protein, partial [Dongiaceae bacterium]|nr:alpha-2-macroglobulin family protein [Dongiaceae bacterium]